jgi:SAM-dependent methyltransferase
MSVAQLPRSASQRVAGSFRDPSGYVFRRGGRLFRCIDAACWQLLKELSQTGALENWIADGLLAPTRFVEVPQLIEALRAEHYDRGHFLEHEPIAPVTYPSEWTISMLADAGVHTIDLQLQLLEQRCALKDASAYNIVFRDARPVFVDVASIEPARRLDVWPALAQFQRMFTYPLLLCRHHGWDPRSYFLAAPGGRCEDQLARAFGPWGQWRSRLLLDFTLPYLLRRRSDGNPGVSAHSSKRAGDAAPQRWNLLRLRKKLTRLAAGYRPRSDWTNYDVASHYAAGDTAAKRQATAKFLQTQRPKTVIDLGCNSGQYSLLAAGLGAHVTAIDSDHDAVETLYRRLKRSPATIAPLVADLTCPTPGVGHRNREWLPLTERVEGECVLALALVHHLLVTGNLSPAAVRDLLFDWTERWLVVEYVPPADPMFQRLLGARRDRLDWLSLESFQRVFSELFQPLGQVRLDAGGRSLLFYEKIA